MPTTILIFTADPSAATHLRLQEEIREIQDRLNRSPRREEFRVEVYPAARPTDLPAQILRYKPDVVHFSGHGTGANGLMMQDERGATALVGTDVLENLFQLFHGRVGCVVLNSCYSKVQAEVIARHVPFVVGMSEAIGDAAAIDFARGFYEALFAGEPVERAFGFGRLGIQLQSIPAAVPLGADRTLLPPGTAPVVVLPEYLKPVLIQGERPAPAPAAEVADAAPPAAPAELLREADWRGLLNAISKGQCTPVVGPAVNDEGSSWRDELTRAWAQEYGYPIEDSGDLARVAQFVAVADDPLMPKDLLLKAMPPVDARRAGAADGPHGALARLQLPLYVTTDYDDSLVVALRGLNKAPRQDACRWAAEVEDLPFALDDPGYKLHPATPLVFHLHGNGHADAASLVLTEDDHLRFLAGMAGRWDEMAPAPVRAALDKNALLFLGYRLDDWSLRLLLQGLRPNPQRRSYLVVPSPQGPGPSRARVREYLEKYYDRLGLRVCWASPREFCSELLRRWREFNGD